MQDPERIRGNESVQCRWKRAQKLIGIQVSIQSLREAQKRPFTFGMSEH